MSRVIEPDDSLPDVPLPADDPDVLEMVEALGESVSALTEIVKALKPSDYSPQIAALIESNKKIVSQVQSVAAKLAASEWDFKVTRDPYGWLESVRGRRIV